MRNLILGISIVCLALSALITFKALNLPEKKLRNPASQPPIKIHESSQVVNNTVLKPAVKQDPGSNGNQTLQNTISHLEQKLENNITDSQIHIQTLGNTVKQLEHKLITIDNATQTDTQSSKNTITQLEQKLADEIADSQIQIQALENTVKQMEQKLADKIAVSQTDTQPSINTVAQLEQKLADKITDSQIQIQTLENTVKQLEQKLADKIADSQTDTQPSINTIAQLEHTPVSHQNTSQSILEIDKPENTQKPIGRLLFEVNFRPAKFVIDDKIKKLIQQSTQDILSQPPNYRIIVEGHTDNIPVKTTPGKQCLITNNMSLSLFRAKKIAGMFEDEGIPSKRISAFGYGATRPIASNNTAEGRAKNRRVVVRLIPEEKGI